jgi:hypothetical protein
MVRSAAASPAPPTDDREPPMTLSATPAAQRRARARWTALGEREAASVAAADAVPKA